MRRARGTRAGSPNEFRPNTLRNNNVGTYIRDQWNITPKITASVGIRWEYYSLPRRADHGIEVYDFDANRLLICGIGPNDENCGIEVEKNLFTPRLGIAYRPMEDFVIRAGYSRNPQSNNPGRQQMVPSQSFPQTIVITEAAPNNVTAVGSPQRGCDDRAAGRSEQRRARPAQGRRGEHLQGRIRARQDLVVEYQRPESLGHAHERDGRLRRESPEWDARNRNVNYGTFGGGCGESAVHSRWESTRR